MILVVSYPEFSGAMLLAVTEMRTKEEIDALATALEGVAMSKEQALIFELSRPGRVAYSLPESDVPEIDVTEQIPAGMLREEPAELPEVSELDLVRHYTALSRRNYGIDNGFYPLGSCTMKYNPKVHEDVARLPGFAQIHPYQPEESVQGALQLCMSYRNTWLKLPGWNRLPYNLLQGHKGNLPV